MCFHKLLFYSILLKRKKKRIGLDCHTFVENKDYSFTNANLFSLYFHRVKRSARPANSARLSQWEAKCVHDYSKISSKSCCTGTKKHFLRQTPLVCVHTFQNMQWVATIPFRVKRIGLMLWTKLKMLISSFSICRVRPLWKNISGGLLKDNTFLDFYFALL